MAKLRPVLHDNWSIRLGENRPDQRSQTSWLLCCEVRSDQRVSPFIKYGDGNEANSAKLTIWPNMEAFLKDMLSSPA